IIKNEISDEEKQATMDKVNEVITANGEVTKTDKWGTRKYAYPIDFKTEGFYVCVEFKAEATVPEEINRLVTVTDNLVRAMVIKK
ncbi:MAG: 30S ribosomal protein S6, partial [Clostridia bacterium]